MSQDKSDLGSSLICMSPSRRIHISQENLNNLHNVYIYMYIMVIIILIILSILYVVLTIDLHPL